jgi:hypothetical protein
MDNFKKPPISTNYYDTVVFVDGSMYKIGYDSVYLSLYNSRTTGWQLWHLVPGNEKKLGDEFENEEFDIYMNDVHVYSNQRKNIITPNDILDEKKDKGTVEQDN